MAGKKKFDWLHVAISWGASVVIVGALFKILHLGGVYGNYMIGAGLGVEAFLFFLTGFFPPAKDLAWQRVYPELSEDYTGEITPTSSRMNPGMNPESILALDRMIADAKIGPDLIQNLGEGMRTFEDKITAISNVADASIATNEFAGKVKTASSGFEVLTQSFVNAAVSLSEMGDTHEDAKVYHEQVSGLGKNISALNAIYELELQDSNSHLKSMGKFYQNLAVTMENFNESMEDSKVFKEEVSKLAKNLSSLNAVYGNMLSAMNQPRL